jgi:hypothetical protein
LLKITNLRVCESKNSIFGNQRFLGTAKAKLLHVAILNLILQINNLTLKPSKMKAFLGAKSKAFERARYVGEQKKHN